MNNFGRGWLVCIIRFLDEKDGAGHSYRWLGARMMLFLPMLAFFHLKGPSSSSAACLLGGGDCWYVREFLSSGKEGLLLDLFCLAVSSFNTDKMSLLKPLSSSRAMISSTVNSPNASCRADLKSCASTPVAVRITSRVVMYLFLMACRI